MPEANKLTTAEFHAAVHALQPRVAVFDCDGTLWSGDAGSAFMRWSMQTGLLQPEAISWLNERYEGYNRGEVSELAICGEMVQVYAGLPVPTLRVAAADFFASYVEPNIFPEMHDLVTALQAHGVEILGSELNLRLGHRRRREALQHPRGPRARRCGRGR